MTQPGKAELAYAQIEQMILFQELAPGALVSEATLMDMTGLGRTPVREALQRLARNRMVEIHPNKGVMIPQNSVEAQLRMLELRRDLEALAVRLACQRARVEEREEMRQMAERLENELFTLTQYTETVKDTHLLIANSTHNEFLADALAPLQGLSRRFWFSHVIDDVTEIRRGASLHVGILRSIVRGDSAAAEAASRKLNDYLVEFSYRSLHGT